MPKSFSLKTVQIAVTLGKGVFSGGGNTKIIEGLACDVSVTKPGLPQLNSASVNIWGLPYDDMVELTMLSFRPLESQHNLISIKAGEKDGAGSAGALSLVFQGEIASAFADLNQAPDPCMSIHAQSGIFPKQMGDTTVTVKGEAPAARLFAQFAEQAGYSFKNEGVTGSVRDAWFPGPPIDKMLKLAHDVGCELLIDDGEVVIMPEGAARQGNAVYLSRATGMVGYPVFTQDGISCRCLFNPDLRHGGLIQVKSETPRASGLWRITKLTHNLGAYAPNGGKWESQIEAAAYE